MCQFEHKSKKIKLFRLRPKINSPIRRLRYPRKLKESA